MSSNGSYNPAGTGVPSVILGADGQPIRRLQESERFETLLGAYDGYLAASFKLPPFNPDAFIAARGYDVLDDMMSMGAVRGPMNVIRDAVLHKGWRVVPAINDRAEADYDYAAEIASAFEYALNNIVDEAGNVYDFRQDLWDMLYAVHMGFRVSEIHWRYLESGPYAGKVGFAGFSHKPCKQIGFDLNPRTFQVRNITQYTPIDGYDFQIPVEKVLRYTFAPKDSLPYGQGIGRAVYKHSWSLDFLYRFWNIALETFGSPFILAKASPTSMGLAQAAIKAIRQGAAPVLPQGVEAELVEIAGGGVQAFKMAAEHHAQSITSGYLANTLTSGEGQRSGSLALGNVHKSQQEYGLGGRRMDLEKVVNLQLARRFVLYNYGPDALPFTPQIVLGAWDASDMAALSTCFKTLIDARVLHPAEDEIRERMGLGPIDPDLKQVMENIWNAWPGASTVPSAASSPGTTDAPDDSEDSDDADDSDDGDDSETQS